MLSEGSRIKLSNYFHRSRCKLCQRPMLPEGSRITQCQLPEGSRIKVTKDFHRSGSEQKQRPMPYKCELQPRNLWHSPAAPENIHLCHLSCVRRPTLSALLRSPIFHPVCADLRSLLSTLSATDMNCIKQCQLPEGSRIK